MKKIIKTTAIAFLMLITGQIFAQVPSCPIKGKDLFGNTVTLFDGNSPFGDKICPALKNLDKIVDGLGNDFNKKVNEVKKAAEDFTKATLKDAINEEAADKYNAAVKSFDDAKKELLKMVKDAECGAPGALKAMQTGFQRVGQDLTQLTGIAVKSGQILAKLKDVIAPALKIANELKDIAASVSAQTPEAKKQVEILQKAATQIVNDLQELAKLDATKLVKSGGNLLTGFAPFLTNCYGCAVALGDAITGIAVAAGGTGGGVATSETGVGAGVGGGVAILGAGQTLVGTLASTPTCKYVNDNIDKVEDYIKDINNFVEAISKIATSLSDNAENVINGSKALYEIGKAVGKENEPRVKSIQKNLAEVADVFGDAAEAIEKEVAPQIAKFAGKKTREIGQDVKQLKECYDKMMDAGGWITKDVIDGGKDLITAGVTLVDVKKVISNLQKQLDNAGDAAQDAVKDSWKNFDKNRDALMKSLLGDKPSDFGEVIKHFTFSVAPNIDKILKTAKDLADDVGGIISGAVKSGQKNFMSQINQFVDEAQKQYKQVVTSSRNCAVEIAKAKAKWEMMAKAAEASRTKLTVQLTQFKVIEAPVSLIKLSTIKQVIAKQ